jgi:hypothetical protein
MTTGEATRDTPGSAVRRRLGRVSPLLWPTLLLLSPVLTIGVLLLAGLSREDIALLAHTPALALLVCVYVAGFALMPVVLNRRPTLYPDAAGTTARWGTLVLSLATGVIGTYTAIGSYRSALASNESTVPAALLALTAIVGFVSVVASIAMTVRAARSNLAEPIPPSQPADVTEDEDPASDPRPASPLGATLLAVAVVALLLCGIAGTARVANHKSLQQQEAPVRADLARDFPGFEVVKLSRRFQRASPGKPATESYDFTLRFSALTDFKLIGTYHVQGPGIDAGSRLSHLPGTLFNGKKLTRNEVSALAHAWVSSRGALPITVGSRRYGAVIRPSILATGDPTFTGINMRTNPRTVYGFLTGPKNSDDIYWFSFDRNKGSWASLGSTAELREITIGP